MSGFELKQDPMETQFIECPTSSLAVTMGDLLERAVGATTWSATTATSGHFTQKAVAIETIAATASVVKCILVHPWQSWAAEVTNTVAAADNGDSMVLTDVNTVNNTHTNATSEYINFIQDGILADGRALGRIPAGNGVNPDAA